MSAIKILSIDGGGMRGIIPALVLAEIEEAMKSPISELFDLIAGTSTGGMLALCLTKPDSKSRIKPQYKAIELVSLYAKEGKRIFDRGLMRRIFTLNGVIEEKYPSEGIEEVLQGFFESTRLCEALAPVIIPAYETEMRTPFFFKSYYPKPPDKKGCGFYMWQAARAASAAPTYFEPYKLEIEDGKRYYSLIDGGVCANNPAMCALAEAKVLFPDASDFVILSLGTGELTRALKYDNIKKWGLLEWARPMLGVIFDGASDAVDYQIKHLLPEENYFRLQVSLEQLGNDDMDDASDRNIFELEKLVRNYINEWKINATLERLYSKLNK